MSVRKSFDNLVNEALMNEETSFEHGLTWKELDKRFPGAFDAHPQEGRDVKMWVEDGSLNSVVGGDHRTRMLWGKDGTWHKYYSTPKPERMERRRPGVSRDIADLSWGKKPDSGW